MELVAVTLLKTGVLMLLLLTAMAYMVLAERKMLAFFHLRLGPNRVGPWGLLQPLADGLKLMFKEDIVPRSADPLVFRLAPLISLATALGVYAVIPFGPPLRVGGREIPLGISDPNAGILILLAVSSLAVYGIALGGWASQSKYSLLGSLRSASQMVSYELALGMSLIGVLALAGSARLSDIVAAQAGGWFVLLQPVGFLVYFIASLAEVNRTPFDLPEAETELVGGYNTEYTGMRFAMFFMAEYLNLITVACLTVLLFLGGWLGPAFLPPVAWFALKVALVLFVHVWLRATLPRMRYDRLMQFGWKVLLPAATVNLLVTAAYVAL